VWIDLKDKHQLVSIIIPAKNKQDYLKRCIDSIVNKSTYRNFEIIVVDNNSDEKEFFDLMDAYKKQDKFIFKYVKEMSPFNFSFLMNKGRRIAKGKYLVSLNNDTEIITPDWMEGLIGQVQRPEIGVAGCKLLYENDTIQHAGVVVGLGGVAAHLFTRQDRDGPGYFNYINLLHNYSALTAACIMVRAEVYDKVNGFDEKFTVEYNDVDFCLKVMEAGYRNVYIPHVELYHYESISRGHPLANPKSVKRHEKEANMFVKKWTKYVENDPCYNPNLTRHNDNFAIKV
jgi:GT2 family glycosyltransferase